jgi:2-polyprenyl-6-hydroxyphenyl methylase/3-demethylubiquinone-9 3-methyltransferase
MLNNYKGLKMSSSINKKEIDHFAKDSSYWWDIDGPFGILHHITPTRMEYILSQTGDVSGKHILDVGCGGGLVCEPLARLGAHVTGLDADMNAIDVANDHASTMGLDVNYVNETIESHIAPPPSDANASSSPPPRGGGGRAQQDRWGGYDIVLALEILEHVNNPQEFIKQCAKHLKPGGILITSTLNRTLKSFGLGIVAAEYVLGLVPRGTHRWKQFIQPAEMRRMMMGAGIHPSDLTGLTVSPFESKYALSNDVSVNYFMSGIK